jgi:hypothetical protein
MTKKKQAKRRPPRKVFATRADKLAATDVDQYNTERMFAAEQAVRDLLEGSNGAFTFEQQEGEEQFGSCELNGVDDARDKNGCGGAWVCVRIYVSNLDIDTVINQ